MRKSVLQKKRVNDGLKVGKTKQVERAERKDKVEQVKDSETFFEVLFETIKPNTIKS